MGELLTDGLGYSVICALAALSVAWLLRRRRPRWSRRRQSFLAALPIPAVTFAICLILMAKIASTSRSDCGVDVCGMVMGLAVIVSTASFWAFVVSWFAAAMMLAQLSR